MKKILLSLLLLSCTNTFAQEFLVIIDDLVDRKDFFVIQQVGERYIAVVNQSELALLKNRQYTCKTLDENPRNNTYYLLFPKKTPLSKISSVSTILETFYEPSDIEIYRHSMLVRVSERNKDLLFNLDVDLNLIEMEKMHCGPYVPPDPGYLNAQASYNPLIQQLVNSVSEDTLRYFVKYLSSTLKSRSAKIKSNADVSVPWIAKKFREYGCDSVFIQTVPGYPYAPNPIGIRLGEKYPSYKKYFVMGGHCDAVPHEEVNHGADDNATGIAAAIEAARVMRKYNFKYTIVYMGFDGEEIGFVGSAEFAKQAKARGDTILGTLTHDMLGRTAPNADYLRIVYRSNITGGSQFAKIYDQAAKTYTALKYKLSPNTSGSEWSDQAPFWQNGYNAICCIESAYGSNSVNHTIYDTLDAPNGLNDTKFLTECARASIAALAMDTLGGWTSASIMNENIDISLLPKNVSDNGIITMGMQGGKVLISVSGLNIHDHAYICIYDACGRQITTMPLKPDAKSTNVAWENRGNAVSSGLYFVQLFNNGKSVIAKKLVYTR